MASDWSNSGASFSFSKNSSSSNPIDANTTIDGPCGHCVAATELYSNIFGYYTQFNLQINLAPGYPFYDGTQAASIPSNYFDLRSVVRHELGHSLGLCHSSSNTALMYISIPTGTTRGVDTDARNGSKYKYQSGYSGPSPSGSCIQ